MSERWRDIEDYEGCYQVSNMGSVRSLDRVVAGARVPMKLKGRALKINANNHGYIVVMLSKNNNQKTFRVSRLVALAFIENSENSPEVDHINEIKTDNRACNLQWLNSQENVERSQSKYYAFVSPEGKPVKIFNLNKFCRKNNLSDGSMCAVNSGRNKQHKGWTKHE